jgi:DnaK suppressor protein
MSSSTMPAERGAAALSHAQLASLRTLLEQQRGFRCDQLDQLHRHDLLRERNDTDREINESLVAGARAALREVLQALRRMAEGSYGTCRRCGERLPIERLEVLPQLSLCMPCQREAERG